MDERDSKAEIDGILFGRYLSGEASPEEVILLEDWISKSASNKLLFEQYLTTWNGFSIEGGYQLPDKRSAWQNLNNALRKTANVSVARKLFPRYSVAAAVVGLAVLSIITLLIFNRTDRSGTVKNISVISVSDIRQNTLPDGSSVVLNSNSKLRFPEKFKPGRREAILEGEGYFTIEPNPEQPFIVRMENIRIQVLGTSFNVRKDTGKGTVETQVKSGKVKMFNADGEIFITAGNTGVYNTKTNTFLLQDSLDVNSFSYATKNFVFSDEELSSIIGYLEKAYSKKIVLENKVLGKCKMTSSFDNKPIEYILDVIAATLDITYNIKGNTIYIGGAGHEGC